LFSYYSDEVRNGPTTKLMIRVVMLIRTNVTKIKGKWFPEQQSRSQFAEFPATKVLKFFWNWQKQLYNVLILSQSHCWTEPFRTQSF